MTNMINSYLKLIHIDLNCFPECALSFLSSPSHLVNEDSVVLISVLLRMWRRKKMDFSRGMHTSGWRSGRGESVESSGYSINLNSCDLCHSLWKTVGFKKEKQGKCMRQVAEPVCIGLPYPQMEQVQKLQTGVLIDWFMRLS